MYATRTTFAATTAVMAAKVELPVNASMSGGMCGVEEVRLVRAKKDAPFHMYFSDAKYDAIGTIPRERLKTISLKSTPVLRMERTRYGWEISQERDGGFLPLPNSLCTCLCRNTPRAHSSLDTFACVVVVVV